LQAGEEEGKGSEKERGKANKVTLRSTNTTINQSNPSLNSIHRKKQNKKKRKIFSYWFALLCFAC
jgi:hypothetical protein